MYFSFDISNFFLSTVETKLMLLEVELTAVEAKLFLIKLLLFNFFRSYS
jgi:hypothetical protein